MNQTRVGWPAVPFVLALASTVGCHATAPRSDGGTRHPSHTLHVCAHDAPRHHATFALEAEASDHAVSASWLAANHCRVRVIDVRERDEIVGELGRIAGAEWLPLADVEQVASTFPSDEPVVFVCRSGRRSLHVARALRQLGLAHVAYLGGGMLAWQDFGLPVTHEPPSGVSRGAWVAAPASEVDGRYGSLVSQALLNSGAIAWTSASTLLSAGTLSCIDGRTERPVIGAAGGDAGELVLALASLERVTGRTIDLARIPPFFEQWIAAFGRFYLHTDEHALDRLREDLAADPRFFEIAHELDTPVQVEAFIRHPPLGLEAPLIEHLLNPPNVGCGHLRLMLQHPEAYGVRAQLTRAVLAAGLRHGIRHPGSIHLEVLTGDHAERAVVQVLFDHPVASYTRLAMVVPRGVLGEAFVLHPQAVAFVRQETSSFLVEHSERLGVGPVDRRRLSAMMDRLGDRQLSETVDHLAATLPNIVMRVSGSSIIVRDADTPD